MRPLRRITVLPTVPTALEPLRVLARNLRWSWHPPTQDLFAAMDDAIDRIETAVRRWVDAGDPNMVEMLKRTGGMEKYDRRRRWWTDHHDRFAAALL